MNDERFKQQIFDALKESFKKVAGDEDMSDEDLFGLNIDDFSDENIEKTKNRSRKYRFLKECVNEQQEGEMDKEEGETRSKRGKRRGKGRV